MKKALIGVLLIISLTAGSGAVYALNRGTFAGFPTVNLRLNGSDIDVAVMETPPVIINDRTYVPLRFISESLGAYVNWDENTRTVIINSSSSTTPDTPGAYSNLPLTQTVDGFAITVKSVVNNPKTNLYSANTTVFLSIKNNSSGTYNINTSKTRIYCSGNSHSFTNANLGMFYSMGPGTVKDGHLVFSPLPPQEKKLTVEIVGTLSGTEIKHTFNVQR